MSEELPRFATVLDLALTGPTAFSGSSLPMPHGRVYGGQLMAQATAAAFRTLPGDRLPHSLHGYFLRPGDMDRPVDYAVEPISDGRSISHRRVQASQDGTVVFTAVVSFQTESAGPVHQLGMPEVPGPAELPAPPADGPRQGVASLFEVRRVEGEAAARLGGAELGRAAVWMRLDSPLPDDPVASHAVMVFASDYALFAPALELHGIDRRTRGLKLTSLDHAMWWHGPVRADRWLLMIQESTRSGDGRGLGQARFYTEEGELVASAAQEFMVRPPQPLP